MTKSCLLVLNLMIAFAVAQPIERSPQSDGFVSVTQNSLGTYNFFIETRDYSRQEEKLPNGHVFGEYTINYGNGERRTVKYKSDENGFQIISGEPSNTKYLPEKQNDPILTLLLPKVYNEVAFFPRSSW